MLKLQPIDTYVILEIKEKEEKKGALVLPDSVQDKFKAALEEGVIVSIGDEAFFELKEKKRKVPVIGDKVIFKKHCGKWYKEEDQTYRILQDIDIYGILAE